MAPPAPPPPTKPALDTASAAILNKRSTMIRPRVQERQGETKGGGMYRSSARKFIQGVLSLLDEGRDISFDQVADLKEYTVADVLGMLRIDKAQRIRDGMPPEDWDEIMTYIGRFSTAHGPRALHFYDASIERSFLCWLAAIGVELLSDV